MAQPVLYTIPSFDAAVGADIPFAYDGEQVFGNELVIMDNATGEQVYSKRVDWMKMVHTISAGSGLQNGKYYACKVRVYNKAGDASSWSSLRSFYCFTTPVFNFTNMASGQILENSEFTLQMRYVQAENEPLNTYNVILYNSSRVQMSKSATLYGTSDLEYSLHDLADATQYYVRCLGETLNGMVADSGYIPFSVKYIVPTYWAYVDLTNNQNDGTVRISSNIRTIEGKYTGDGEPAFIDDNKIDLRLNGNRVLFHDGFAVQGNFTIKMLANDLVDGETILTLTDKDGVTVNLQYIVGWFAEGSQMAAGRSASDEKLGAHVPYLELRCSSPGNILTYIMESNPMPELTDGQEYLIKLRKMDDTFDLTVSAYTPEN